MEAAGTRRSAPTVAAALALVILLAGCGAEATAPKQTAEQVAPERTTGHATDTAGQTGRQRSTGLATDGHLVVAAGDIASCESQGDEATADLLATIDGTVLALGDEAYDEGSTAEFRDCYDPTWGRIAARTKPTPGNHEYETAGAKGYFDYFGKAAGDPGKGYYSYDLGNWHLVSLNSNCEEIGGCDSSSPQVRWLKSDLAANDERCTLAYMHHPRFSSGEEHGSTPEVKPLWEALYAAGVDIVLSGHEHNYERFAPQDPGGRADPERGIREFVVGTGGKSHYAIVDPLSNSEVHNDDTYGILELTLHPNSYDWRFVPAEGGTFTDSGSARCHP
jgi:acid phosphatase type 7